MQNILNAPHLPLADGRAPHGSTSPPRNVVRPHKPPRASSSPPRSGELRRRPTASRRATRLREQKPPRNWEFTPLEHAARSSSPFAAVSAAGASVPYPVSPYSIKPGGSTSTPPLTLPRHPFELSLSSTSPTRRKVPSPCRRRAGIARPSRPSFVAGDHASGFPTPRRSPCAH